MILMAYQDRKDLFLQRVIPFVVGGNRIAANKLNREIGRQIGVRYPQSLKRKIDKRREIYEIDTGIRKLNTRGGRLVKIK